MEGTLRYSLITIPLTTAKLDATGQRWVVSLANYNFKLHYRSCKLNVEVGVLSRIPWEQEGTLQTFGAVIVKAIISRGCNGDSSVPEIPPHAISVVPKNLVVDDITKLTKHDWKMVQQGDPDIGPVITLINNKIPLQYVVKEVDPF